jgi:probable rRNA maturation factor
MRRIRPKPALDIGVRVAAPAWRRALPGAVRHAERAARAAYAAARGARLPRVAVAEAAVVLAGNARVRALNRAWRGQDKPTNVLAFAALDDERARRASARRARDATQPVALGDVIVALETARAEARADGKPLADHLSHLVVHGILHLLGHDHRRARDARKMERLEIRALGLLDVPNPYAAGPSAPGPTFRSRRRRTR